MNLKIFDETLRDGEQQAGLFMSLENKYTLARMILETGVHYIDIMPVIHESEGDLVSFLSRSGHREKVIPATILKKEDIDLLDVWGINKLILFAACSDRLIKIRDKHIGIELTEGLPDEEKVKGARERNAHNILRMVKYASMQKKKQVFFALEDATRADIGYLNELLMELAPYTKSILLCDTVGVLTPSKSYDWVKSIVPSVPCDIGIHFHNDMGLALENTLRAVEAGATVISGTFRGIGERAGNVSLEQVLNGLRERFSVTLSDIHYDKVEQLCNHMDAMGYKAAAPYSKESKRHESGIHVNALLHDKQAYCIFEGQEPEIWFGKFSGSSNFKYLFEKILHTSLEDEEYNFLRYAIKNKSYMEQRCFSSDEVIKMLHAGEISLKPLKMYQK